MKKNLLFFFLLAAVAAGGQTRTAQFVDSAIRSQRADYHSKPVSYVLNGVGMPDSASFYARLDALNWKQMTYCGYIPCNPKEGGCNKDIVIVSFNDLLESGKKKKLIRASRREIADPVHYSTRLWVNNQPVPDADKQKVMESLSNKEISYIKSATVYYFPGNKAPTRDNPQTIWIWTSDPG